MSDDLISRQAAIDAIRASASKYTGFMEMEMYTDDDAIEAIEGLPSAQPDLSGYSDRLWRNAYERGKRDAQPEIIRCKDCKHYVLERGDASFALGWCPFIKSHLVMSKGFCAWAERSQMEE